MPNIKKNSAAVAVLGPDSNGVGERDEEAPDSDLEMIAQELVEAVHARNSKDVSACLRAAFECLESQPHEEYEESEDDEE